MYDLTIIGGGLVGGSLACALADTGLRIALIEATATDGPNHPSYDERVIALALGSQRIFAGMGLWPAIAPAAEPIATVHISERGRFGCARLTAAEVGVPALGYVVPARAMGAAIAARLAAAGRPASPATSPAAGPAPGPANDTATADPPDDADDHHPAIEVLRPARLIGLSVRPDRVQVEVGVGGHSRVLATRLLVAADGGDSAVRKRLKLRATERSYGHDAIITTVTAGAPQPGTAFERFTDSGPLALLPMTEGRWSVVWTAREADTPGLLGLADAAFLAQLQQRFGGRLGTLSRPGRRLAYPLRLMLARDLTQSRVLLIGNAAHTLHPVAGQGFNLGLRDVAELADLLSQARRTGQDPGGDALLAAYRARRGADQAAVAMLTDGLARLFVNPWGPVRLGRELGLVGLGLVPAARRLFARRLMGLAGGVGGDGRQPRLARGLPVL